MSFRSFISLVLTVKSTTHFFVNFCTLCKVWMKLVCWLFFFLHVDCKLLHYHLLKRLFFPSKYSFCTFVKNQLTIYIYTYIYMGLDLLDLLFCPTDPFVCLHSNSRMLYYCSYILSYCRGGVSSVLLFLSKFG